ncbi:thioredoxin family protein [Thalassotalea fusca]
MDVQLLVTKTDFCLPNLECELKSIGIDYHVEYIEDNPELVSDYHIRHSPNIFVDNKLVFRHQPSPSELKAYFHG